MKKKYTYALYHGDTFIDLGSRKHIARVMGVTERSVDKYTYPSYRKRIKDEDKRIIVIKWKD